jgi:hypothetical protein
MRAALAFVAVVGSLALGTAAERGVKPRPAPAEYTFRSSAGSLTIGAELIPARRVAQLFSTDLNRGYMIVEVGVYPGTDQNVELDARDFVIPPPSVGVGMDRRGRTTWISSSPASSPKSLFLSAPRPWIQVNRQHPHPPAGAA